MTRISTWDRRRRDSCLVDTTLIPTSAYAAGHRRLAFIGGPEGMITTRERLAGYRRAIREVGPSAESVAEFFGRYTSEHGRVATEQLLASGTTATAIFYTSDAALLGGLEVLRRTGRHVPDDVSVVSFDDVEPLNLFAPPITAVRQPLAEMGQRAKAVSSFAVRNYGFTRLSDLIKAVPNFGTKIGDDSRPMVKRLR